MVDRTHGETKLWESFIKGETAAFEEVYRRYYSLLYSYGIRMVGDRELVADTMTVERIRAELQRILYAFQSLRPMEVIEECHEFFPMGEEIINSLFKKDDVDVKNERRLAKAISRLSGRQREILYLYYVKELSHQEISAILGMNPQSSKNLLSRTLARLREFFFSVSTIWIFSILVHCVHVPVRSVWAFHFS